MDVTSIRVNGNDTMECYVIHASAGLAQACPNKTLAAKLYILQTVGTRHDYHRIHSDVSSFP